MPDSPESRLAEMRARLEGVEIAVRAFANLPMQVGILQHDVDDIQKGQERLRQQMELHLKDVRTEVKALELAGDRREEERRERESVDRETKRVERKQDIRWRIATLLTLVGFAITILIAIAATYSA